MKTKKRPEKLGTVWTANAVIQFIDESDDTPRWRTVATCMDTPRAIGEAMATARQNHPGKTLWINDVCGRRISS